jgi:hypothetical protein
VAGVLMELPDVAKVERLSLRPGDRLVLSFDRYLDDAEFDEVTRRTREWVRDMGLPDGGVVVLEGGASLQVLEAGTG